MEAPLSQQVEEEEAMTGHYASGLFSSRPSFKRAVREFSALAQSSLTFYAMDMFRQKKTSAGVASVTGYNMPDVRSNKTITQALRETEALMTAHNTITGTSTKVVIQNAERIMRQTRERNEDIMAEAVRMMAQNEEGLVVSELHQCLERVGLFDVSANTTNRTDVSNTTETTTKWCPTGMTAANYASKSEFVSVIYNPSVFAQEYTMIPLQIPYDEPKGVPKSNVSVVVWDKQQRAFINCPSEQICYKKPTKLSNEISGNDSLIGCELYVYKSVPPLGFDIVKVQYGSGEDLIGSQGADNVPTPDTPANQPQPG
jgi:hypothetical protein